MVRVGVIWCADCVTAFMWTCSDMLWYTCIRQSWYNLYYSLTELSLERKLTPRCYCVFSAGFHCWVVDWRLVPESRWIHTSLSVDPSYYGFISFLLVLLNFLDAPWCGTWEMDVVRMWCILLSDFLWDLERWMWWGPLCWIDYRSFMIFYDGLLILWLWIQLSVG